MKYVDLRENHPAYSNQICLHCEHIERGNRLSRSDLLCKKGVIQPNTDLNVSRNHLDYDQWSLEQKAMIFLWESESLSVA